MLFAVFEELGLLLHDIFGAIYELRFLLETHLEQAYHLAGLVREGEVDFTVLYFGQVLVSLYSWVDITLGLIIVIYCLF